MSAATPSWYDVLDVPSTASTDEIRTAWREGVAELGPTDRRFRLLNQAAEVLLDPERRAAHDAELAEQEALADPAPTHEPTPAVVSAEPAGAAEPGLVAVPPGAPAGRSIPAWLLAGLAVLTALLVGLSAWQWTKPSDADVRDATVAAQSAAERAIVPVLSYDYRTLEEDQQTARSYLTKSYREDYDELFEFLKENSPNTETVVEAEVLASGVVRSGADRVQVLLFVNRPTTNKQNKEPIIYKDQVTVTMVQVDGEWLVSDLQTTPLQG